ncbi:hypothetical protein D9619_003809 [Psilocybe cf. subviscida]|uniref:F-box domain-containing protein n=1 Tax=Psilocybe cf. subviscida TaxID=2480587 RepID=A0A8H5AWC7_9AGAR|nr:hypothetical protein D9619_003809 [Psilocybe cf. subviscida]
MDPPRLPPELYREIAANLSLPSTRNSLTLLSLVNKDWCNASQQILFRSFYEYDEGKPGEDEWSVVAKHYQFLKRITDSPKLASYVRFYAQYDLSWDPECVETYFAEDSNLWGLTARALPLMTNLKHLHLSFSNDQGPHACRQLLEACNFQLDTLTWECDDVNDLRQHFIPFLRTQRSLWHLGVGTTVVGPQNSNLSWLPRDVCPSLISTESDFGSIVSLAEKRSIVASYMDWKCVDPETMNPGKRIQDEHLSVLQRLKYLKVAEYSRLRDFSGPVNLDITLLVLGKWNFESIKQLDHLPELRILSLLECTDLRKSSNEISAITAFGRCPKLKYVIVQEESDTHLSRHTRLFITRTGGPDILGNLPRLNAEPCYIFNHPGTIWWKQYDVN